MKYEKYEKNYYDNYDINEEHAIENVLDAGENILWRGKPKKKAFVLNKIFSMLPIAIIWLLFDSVFIFAIIFSDAPAMVYAFIIPFFALHLTPVWIWLGNVLTASRRWKNTEYVITDRRILIKSGFVGIDYQTLNYKNIMDVNINVGFFDRILKTGDISISSSSLPTKGKSTYCFFDI